MADEFFNYNVFNGLFNRDTHSTEIVIYVTSQNVHYTREIIQVQSHNSNLVLYTQTKYLKIAGSCQTIERPSL